LSSTAIHYLR